MSDDDISFRFVFNFKRIEEGIFFIKGESKDFTFDSSIQMTTFMYSILDIIFDFVEQNKRIEIPEYYFRLSNHSSMLRVHFKDTNFDHAAFKEMLKEFLEEAKRRDLLSNVEEDTADFLLEDIINMPEPDDVS